MFWKIFEQKHENIDGCRSSKQNHSQPEQRHRFIPCLQITSRLQLEGPKVAIDVIFGRLVIIICHEYNYRDHRAAHDCLIPLTQRFTLGFCSTRVHITMEFRYFWLKDVANVVDYLTVSATAGEKMVQVLWKRTFTLTRLPMPAELEA